MSNVPIKDAEDNTRKVDVFTRTEGLDVVETQAIAVVDPASGQPLDLATEATVAALLTAAQAIQAAAVALNAKTTAVDTGAIEGIVALDASSLTPLQNIDSDIGAKVDAPATDDSGTFSLIALFKRALGFWASLASVVRASNSPFTDGDKGFFVLGKRRDSDTTIVADGDYAGFNMDEAGRLKVATQPGSIPATTIQISSNGGIAAINTSRMGTLSLAMVANALVGHNGIFEFSNDSTNGTDGNWKSVQAVRTDANLPETTTGVLAATPVYGWELNVSAYAWFRVRAVAHTSGAASYTFKPGSFATEPVPSSQGAPAQVATFSQAGAIALNTILMTIDCTILRTLAIQCTSMGTAGVVIAEWSNDNVVWSGSFNFMNASAVQNTFNSANLYKSEVFARFFRLRVSTAATAGTTAIAVAGFQTASPTLTQIVGSVGLSAGNGRIGFVAGSGVWYDDSSTVLAAAATFTGTSRDIAAVTTGTFFNVSGSMPKELRASAESDQAGTLFLEVSSNSTVWRRIKAVPTAVVTGGGQYAEIIHRPSLRYARVGFTNGATLQTRFLINSMLIAA